MPPCLGDRIASELKRGSLDRVYISGSDGIIVLMAIGEEAVLTVLARSSAKLGSDFLDARRATEDLEQLSISQNPGFTAQNQNSSHERWDRYLMEPVPPLFVTEGQTYWLFLI